MTAPTNPAEQEKSAERSSKSIRCPKCGQTSIGGRNTCESCGSHLYVSCRDCGERNPRVRSRCTNCGRRLHRPFLQKLFTRKLGRKVKVTPLQLLLLVVAVAIGYKAIIFFIESLSQSQPTESAAVRAIWRA